MSPGPFRSRPGAAGGWAHLLGSLFALILPAALGFALTLAFAALLPAEPARSPIPARLQPWLSALAASPILTWIVLLPGIPFAVAAVRRGRAGWATLALWGGALWLAVAFVLGGLFYAAWVSALGPPGEGGGGILGGLGGAATFFLVGACGGAAYWVGLRLAAPHLFRGPEDPPGT